jgi:predicted metal-dependent peptidase
MPLVQTLDKSPVAGDGGRWKKLKLSVLAEQAWAETKAGMLWAVPSFADIWLAMMIDKDGEQAWFTDQVETAATDDKYLYINMDWFFKLTLDERLFVACHEIAHAMYGHAGLFYLLDKAGEIRYSDGLILPFDYDLMNCAADYVINDQLVAAKIGKMPDCGLHWPALINGDMGALDAYRLLYKVKKNGGGRETEKRTTKQGQQQGSGSGKSFDKLLKPGGGTGKKPNKAMSERSQAEWDTTVTAAMESAKLQGRLPANLERLFVKRLTPKADWRDLYRLAVSRKVGNDRYTWDRLEPQLIYRGIGSPGRSTFGCNLVVIAVDTSGSISQHTLDVFLAETAALLEQAKPKRVIFVQCDAEIQEWDECDACTELFGRKLKGGGGTDFKPVFERVTQESEEPDLLVYLTDLYGDFPSKPPSYPVIWGAISEATVPWGEVVRVPAQVEGE